jgi:type I restriction enzyme S subunit
METIKLSEACEVLNGYAFKSENYVDEGIRIIRIANVQKGFIEDTDPAFYPVDTAGLEKYMLREGDLLMSLTGNVGRVALLKKDMLPAALNQRVACLRLKRDDILLEYIFHVLSSDLFESKSVASSKGVAQKNMSTEWLKEYEIPLLPIKEQKETVEKLNST